MNVHGEILSPDDDCGDDLGDDGTCSRQRSVLEALRQLGATASRGHYASGRDVLARALGREDIPSVEELLTASDPPMSGADEVVARAFAWSPVERHDLVDAGWLATVHAQYLALVHMSQTFRRAITVVEVRGNNGSIDDDPPADSPYTEWRLSPAGERLVDTRGPRVPLAFVTGREGMLPAFRLSAVVHTLLALLRDPDAALALEEPVVPVGSVVWRDSTSFVREGAGELLVEGDAHNEGDRIIVVSSLPWLVPKATWHASMARQMRSGEAPDLRDIRDESDGRDVRLVVTPQRGRFQEALARVQSALSAEHRVVLRLEGEAAPTPPRGALLRFLAQRRQRCGDDAAVRRDLESLLDG